MSRTDNTMPFKLQLADSVGFFGSPDEFDAFIQDTELSPIHSKRVGGSTGRNGDAKELREMFNSRRRQLERSFCHGTVRLAKAGYDLDEFDIPPIRGDKRTIQWNLA